MTDYALARRAVLRDFQQGAVTRLDVCDAHPELLRAATYLGTELADECPVCGTGRMRDVTYVYGDKLKQANGRCIANEHELAGSDAPTTNSPVTTSRSASTAAGTTSAGSRCTAGCTPAEHAAPGARPLPGRVVPFVRPSTRSCGYCEQHETHHSSGSGTTVSDAAWSQVSGTT